LLREGLRTAENVKPEQGKTSNMNLHAILLAVIGIIVVIAGTAIITVRGAPLRGSGAGTALLVIGLIMLIISFLRFYRKPQK
jgi:membrane-bound ClpP family serine protease